MTVRIAAEAIWISWIVWLVVWWIAAREVKPDEVQESAVSAITTRAIMVAGALLLFDWHFGVRWLGSRFVPYSRANIPAGAVVTLAGLCLTLWARYHLGRNWSATVTLKVDHNLVRTGPYTLMRHPSLRGHRSGARGHGTGKRDVEQPVWRARHRVCLLVEGAIGERIPCPPLRRCSRRAMSQACV